MKWKDFIGSPKVFEREVTYGLCRLLRTNMTGLNDEPDFFAPTEGSTYVPLRVIEKFRSFLHPTNPYLDISGPHFEIEGLLHFKDGGFMQTVLRIQKVANVLEAPFEQRLEAFFRGRFEKS